MCPLLYILQIAIYVYIFFFLEMASVSYSFNSYRTFRFFIPRALMKITKCIWHSKSISVSLPHTHPKKSQNSCKYSTRSCGIIRTPSGKSPGFCSSSLVCLSLRLFNQVLIQLENAITRFYVLPNSQCGILSLGHLM